MLTSVWLHLVPGLLHTSSTSADLGVQDNPKIMYLEAYVAFPLISWGGNEVFRHVGCTHSIQYAISHTKWRLLLPQTSPVPQWTSRHPRPNTLGGMPDDPHSSLLSPHPQLFFHTRTCFRGSECFQSSKIGFTHLDSDRHQRLPHGQGLSSG